jgi:ATP-dependent Lhr-like helicase
VAATRRGSSTPSPATPLALVTRQDLAWMLAATRDDRPVAEPQAGASADILAVLRQRGACFRSELGPATGRLSTEVDEGLWDLVARGIVTADAFAAVRSLLSARRRQRTGVGRAHTRRASLGLQRSAVGSGTGEGRWSVLPEPDRSGAGPQDGPPAEEMAEAVAWQLLARWGVVAFEVWSRESYRTPWRDVVRALRRLEARGQALGGRFVAGMSGEQYALPEAVALLGEVHADPGRGDDVTVAGADPLNLTGEWLGGDRVPAVRHRSVHYRNGAPAETELVASSSA